MPTTIQADATPGQPSKLALRAQIKGLLQGADPRTAMHIRKDLGNGQGFLA